MNRSLPPKIFASEIEESQTYAIAKDPAIAPTIFAAAILNLQQ